MQLTNSATGEVVVVQADNLVQKPEGWLWVESMFSGVVDLTAPDVNIAGRLHPNKTKVFEWIVTENCLSAVPKGSQERQAVLIPGEPLCMVPDVQIGVNRLEGGIVYRHFSEFLDAHRELAETGSYGDVRCTIPLSGFDPQGEPVLRRMGDGSVMLIFCCMPPLITGDESSKARRFSFNTFGSEMEKAVGVPVLWDDREVFVVQKPNGNTVETLRQFVETYWQKTSRPWWKFW